MTEGEYREVKAARTALLCKGDTVYYIFRPIGLVEINGKRYPYPIKVRKCTVVEIADDHIATQTIYNMGLKPAQWSRRLLETYEGEIYIWPVIDSRPYPTRIDTIAEVLKSPDTEFDG
jgi:hypothetical protein